MTPLVIQKKGRPQGRPFLSYQGSVTGEQQMIVGCLGARYHSLCRCSVERIANLLRRRGGIALQIERGDANRMRGRHRGSTDCVRRVVVRGPRAGDPAARRETVETGPL